MDERALDGGDAMEVMKIKGPMGTWEERRHGMSHERSFWRAWFHIARWREQEVDALKEGKARVFHRRQARWAMTVMFSHWRIRTRESSNGGIYCFCCEMWLNGPAQYEYHKVGKKHQKNIKYSLATGAEASSTACTADPGCLDDLDGFETSSTVSWLGDQKP